VAAVDVLAQNIFGDTRSGALAGPLGLLILVLLALGTVFLIRNMNARLRRLPDHFPNQELSPDQRRSPDQDRPDASDQNSADNRPDPADDRGL
jgi:hypothetical protein